MTSESEDFDVSEFENTECSVEVHTEVEVPRVGMEFNNVDELYEHCLCYARKVGYPVKKTSQTKHKGILRYVAVACSKGGKFKSKSSNPLLPQPTGLSGCKARISAKLLDNGKWTTTHVNLEHNHILSPGKVRHYRCNRKINPYVARQLEICDLAGIKTSRSFKQQVVAAGGHENVPFTERDARNYIEKRRRLRLGEGDAEAIQQYFLAMQRKNNGFVFMMELDDKSRLRNVFWADRRSREAYKEFGDVVTFDTTYLTNKYHLPFAPFVGVNHHGQSILLGCALLSNEDTETFSWLFRTWLSCMEDKAPAAIITDQDQAMQNAIQNVFPNTRHRWCIWHVMKKIPHYLSMYKQFNEISYTLREIVYETLSVEEFEHRWMLMIEKYGLGEHKWLNHMYQERRRWVPIYVKDKFWAGMQSTQRSESVNAFFDGYVGPKTTLKLFVEQYNSALKDKVEKEAKEDFKSYNLEMPCVSPFQIEKQVRDKYTLKKFKDFQEEIRGKLACETVNCIEFDHVYEYKISEEKEIGKDSKTYFYKVFFEPIECEVRCNCLLFEFSGILCRHAITVLCKNKVVVIPDKYILRRWRKDVARPYTKINVNYGKWDITPEQTRYEDLSLSFNKIASVASENEKSTEHLKAYLLKYKPETNSPDKVSGCSTTSKLSGYIVDCEDNARQDILDPVSCKAKGRPRENRLKPKIYKSKKKRETTSKMPTSDPVRELVRELVREPVRDITTTQESQLGGIVTQENMLSTPTMHMSHMDLLMGVYRPEMYDPLGTYGGNYDIVPDSM